MVPTSSRCRATSSVEPLLGVGTTFTKVALLGSYSCEKQSDAAESFLTPVPQPPLGRFWVQEFCGHFLEYATELQVLDWPLPIVSLGQGTPR